MSQFGDPAAVEAAAESLRHNSVAAETARSNAKRARPDAWQGGAADAFALSVQNTLPPAAQLSDALLSASGTLTRYAAVQRNSKSDFEEAQANFDSAKDALRTNPFNIFAGFDLAKSSMSGLRATGQIQQAAATAADELRALGNEDGDGRAWWDPFGWFNDPEEPDVRVKEDIMSDDSFDPDDISQGQIGDCFMLSTVVSLMNTDEGDQFIRDNIRWDPDEEGYWVTLYEDGVPEEVFVEYVFEQGATQEDWKFLFLSGDRPSIAALYESALQQKYGYDYLDGGYSWSAMEKITGQPVEQMENSGYGGLNPRQVDSLRETLEAGGQATVSSPTGGEHTLTVTDPDGNTREVDLVTSHSYVITRIEEDGSMWVRNPWGPGNSADGGGEFRVSAEDVSSKFWRAASTNVTE
ncbi:MAG: C2 family cysteine protease [Leucobacter sp.]